MADDRDEGAKLTTGRLARFGKMASLAARTAGSLAIGQAKRKLGGDENYDSEKAAALKVLETLGTMKGAAMKLGQQLAMDADALPPEAREIVQRLFAQAPAMSYADIAQVVVEEFGKAPNEVFARFDEKPLASASLGQVHRAALADGTELAVKVQYPGVAEALANDLANGTLLTKAINGMSKSLASLDAGPYYEEIRREIGAETDYLREAALNADFQEALKGYPELHVPRVFPEVSTGRVLSMEYVEGIRLNDFANTNADAATRWRVGRQLVTAVLGPVSTHNMVHGDPHPGNFLVRPDGRMTVLDFGAVKKLPPAFVDAFDQLLVNALAGRDVETLELFESVGFVFKGDRKVAAEMIRKIDRITSQSVLEDEFDWGESNMPAEMRGLVRNNLKDMFEMQAPPESLLFYRAMGGMAQNLKLIRSAGPFRKLAQEIRSRRRRAAS